jgi:serine phosphatase RsbU (regulator of sigma subunit)/Tfp pilus assembly protein PilF
MQKLFLLKFFILLFVNFSQVNITMASENPYLDSLKRELKVVKNDSVKLILLYEIGDQERILRISYWDSLHVFAKKINDKEYESEILNNKAFIYQTQGNVKKAIEYFLKSLKLREKNKNLSGVANSYNNIGYVYSSVGKKEKALYYYLKSFKIRKELNDDVGTASSANNIGSFYMDENDFKKALYYYNLSYELRKNSEDLHGLAYTLNNLGTIYMKLNDFDKALKYHLKSFELRNKIGDTKGIAYSLNNIGRIYQKNGNIDLALQKCQEAYSIANKLPYPELKLDVVDNLYLIYKAKNQNTKALEMLEIVLVLKDSLFNDGIKNAVLESEMQYEFDKKEALVKAKQDKRNALAKAELNQKKIQLNFMIVGFVFVFILAIVIFRGFRQKQKINKIISQQKNEVEQQKLLLEEKNQEITDSITYAKRIQSAILPQEKTIKSYFPNSFILYKPKDIVAGDFYWFEVIDDLIFFAAADCTGHGVPGAMVSVVCNNALNRSIKEFALKNPAEILNKTREIVISEFEKSDDDVKDGMDISLCVFNLKEQKLFWAGAHNPLWLIRDSKLIEFKADRQPIGRFEFAKNFTYHEIEIQKNDTFYLFTDGFQDQFGGEKQKKFRVAQMKDLFLSLSQKSMEEQYEIIGNTFENWKGEINQIDDVCIIGIKI